MNRQYLTLQKSIRLLVIKEMVLLESSKQIFGSRLKQLRVQNNLSMAKTARLLNLKSTGSIAAFESGNGYPSVETLMKIAKLFNVSTDYLLGNENSSDTVSNDKNMEIQTLKKELLLQQQRFLQVQNLLDKINKI